MSLLFDGAFPGISPLWPVEVEQAELLFDFSLANTKTKAFYVLSIVFRYDWWRNAFDSRAHPQSFPFQWPRSLASLFTLTVFLHFEEELSEAAANILESHVTPMQGKMSLLTNSCSAASTTNDADNMNNSSACLSLPLLKSRTFNPL